MRILFAIIVLLCLGGCATLKPPPESLPDPKLSEVVPSLRSKVVIILKTARQKYPQYHWVIMQSYRSLEDQKKFYTIGRRGIPGEKTITNTLNSKHLTGEAVDIYPRIHGHILKYDRFPEVYAYYGNLAKKLGLAWGGDWQDLKDYGHIELK